MLKIDATVIDNVNKYNFLGIIINNLNWKKHIEKTTNKCSKTIRVQFLINKNFFLPIHIKLTLYNTLIQPYINYGIMVWGFKCGRIFKIQKRAIRIVNLSKDNAHTDPIFKQLNILKAEDILRIQQYKFYYKFTHLQLNKNILDMLKEVFDQ